MVCLRCDGYDFTLKSSPACFLQQGRLYTPTIIKGTIEDYRPQSNEEKIVLLTYLREN